MADKGILRAKARADLFDGQLRRLLKRYRPREFGPAVASIVFNVIDKAEMWQFYPLHHLVHSIEANCAYHMPYHHERVTRDRINQVMNHYKDYEDPYLEHMLKDQRSLELFSLALARQQFPLQEKYGKWDLARCLRLFVEGDPLPKSSAAFQGRYGVSFWDWVAMSFSVQAFTLKKRPPLTRACNYYTDKVPAIPGHAVEPFFKMSSLTPQQIGSHWTRRRKIPSHLHIFIPSIFFDYPLVSYDDGSYLVVHPYLVFRNAQEGLYRRAQVAAPVAFPEEIGKRFQRHVGEVIGEMHGVGNIVSEDSIQQVSPGRACDFVVDMPDLVLLVECKATKYSSTLLTENAIAKDNSTGKVAEGFEQIHETAVRISGGELDGVLPKSSKPLLGLLVTYGDLPFVNSRYYFEALVGTRMAVGPGWPAPLASQPQVMDIGTFEGLVAYSKTAHASLLEVVEKKLSQPFNRVGDWPQYLASLSEGKVQWEDLPFLCETADRFIDQFLPRGAREID